MTTWGGGVYDGPNEDLGNIKGAWRRGLLTVDGETMRWHGLGGIFTRAPRTGTLNPSEVNSVGVMDFGGMAVCILYKSNQRVLIFWPEDQPAKTVESQLTRWLAGHPRPPVEPVASEGRPPRHLTESEWVEVRTQMGPVTEVVSDDEDEDDDGAFDDFNLCWHWHDYEAECAGRHWSYSHQGLKSCPGHEVCEAHLVEMVEEEDWPDERSCVAS